VLVFSTFFMDIIGRGRYGHAGKGRTCLSHHPRLPGGVALNIRCAGPLWLVPCATVLLERDPEGGRAYCACKTSGASIRIIVYRSDDLPTDRYMAVEGTNGPDSHRHRRCSFAGAAATKILPPVRRRIHSPTPYRWCRGAGCNLTLDLFVTNGA